MNITMDRIEAEILLKASNIKYNKSASTEELVQLIYDTFERQALRKMKAPGVLGRA